MDDFEGYLTTYAATISAFLNGKSLTNWYQPPPMAVLPTYAYSVPGPSVATNPAVLYILTPMPVTGC